MRTTSGGSLVVQGTRATYDVMGEVLLLRAWVVHPDGAVLSVRFVTTPGAPRARGCGAVAAALASGIERGERALHDDWGVWIGWMRRCAFEVVRLDARGAMAGAVHSLGTLYYGPRIDPRAGSEGPTRHWETEDAEGEIPFCSMAASEAAEQATDETRSR